MADYSIKIGTELDTSGINADLKKYKGNPIKIKSKLDTAGIKSAIAKYKAKPIEINTKLNTKGIAAKIKAFKPKTPIELNAKLNPQGINAAIKKYQAKDIKLNANLSFKGVAGQITEFSKNVKPINLKAELNKSAISNAIKEFNNTINAAESKIKIKIKAEPDLKGIDKKIRAYEVRSPLRVKVKIDKTDINNQIKQYGESKRYITVKAKLDNGAISQAIREYKTNTPIKVDLELDHTDIDKKVSSYAAKGGVEIPAQLVPSAKGFTNGLTKKPVLVDAKLNPEDINKAIDKFKPRSKIKADVKLVAKDINAEIKSLPKPTETIDVGVGLDASKINADIALFQPTATLGIKPDLIIEDVDNQIAAYVPKATLKVNVKINNNDLNKEAKKQASQEVVQVNVQLNPDKINEQIKTFKTTSKIKVGVKLDSKGIAEQIKKIEPKTKIKVGIKIDPEDVARQVGNVDSNTPIKLGVELDKNSVKSQIDSIRQQFEKIGKIEVKIFGVDNNGRDNANRTSDSTSSAQRSTSASNIAKGFKEANIEIEATNSQIRNLGTALSKIGFDKSSVKSMTSEFKELGVTVTNVTSKLNSDGSVRLTVKGLDQFKNAITLVNNVGADGKLGAWSETISSDVNKVAENFNRLKTLAKDIGNLKIDIFKSDDVNEVKRLTEELNRLQKEYNELFAGTQSGLKTGQLTQLDNIAKKSEDALSKLKKEYAETRAELAKEIRGNFSGYDAQVKSLERDINKLSHATPEVEIGIENIKQALQDMNNAADDDSLIAAQDRFQKELKETQAQLEKNKATEGMDFDDDTFEIKKEAALARLNGLFEEGSQAAKRFGAEAQELRTKLDQVGNEKGIDNVNRKIGGLEKKIKAANVQTQTWSTRIKEQFSKYTQYLSVASVLMYSFQAARDMFEQVKLIDSAMTELKKVTDETDASYNKFLSNAATRSKELGTTIDGLVSSTADFARLGYSFKDSQGLAEVANIYAVVGDEIEGVEGATESLISTMAAFKDDMTGMSNTDIAMSIIDTYNELGNKFAISSGGLGEALERSASSLAAANNTLHESAALITAANEVVNLCHAA